MTNETNNQPVGTAPSPVSPELPLTHTPEAGGSGANSPAVDPITALTGVVASLATSVQGMQAAQATPAPVIGGGGVMSVPQGVENAPLTFDDVQNMSPDEVNERWDEVKPLLATKRTSYTPPTQLTVREKSGQ